VRCGRRYDRYGRRVGEVLKGVDIDAIHRNPRWIKIEEAA